MQVNHLLLLVVSLLAGCDSGPAERPQRSSERTAMRAHTAVPPGSVRWQGDEAAASPSASGRGRIVYQAFCVPCHGETGRGDGPITTHGYPAPPSLLLLDAADLSASHVLKVIEQGQGRMMPMADRIDRADRLAVADYVLSLRGAVP